ncbi:MAG: hypothetical protein WC449_00375 [Candidatus Paceibacterota bacterium]
MANRRFVKFLIASAIFLVFSGQAFASSLKFNVDSGYDAFKRSTISTNLSRVSGRAYFYIDSNFWSKLNDIERTRVHSALSDLAQEYDAHIYPKITEFYGSEWNPGIDKDPKVYFVFHEMSNNTAGYFREKDQYDKLQVPNSNQKEVVFLNAEYLLSPNIKSYLAHEFTHLAIFNRKTRINGNGEEVWVQELLAEYTPTLLGYNEVPTDNTYLEKRVRKFTEDSSKSIVDWQNDAAGYAAGSIFIHYAVDQYGPGLLKALYRSPYTGISGFNDALRTVGAKENFQEVFNNWTVANFLNDCSLSSSFCYKNAILKKMRVVPMVNFLPTKGESKFYFSDTMPNWSAKWYKIVGGIGNLRIEFSGNSSDKFVVPYILQSKDGKNKIGYIDLANKNKGYLSFENFVKDNNWLVFIPSAQNMQKKNALEYEFNWSVYFTKSASANSSQTENKVSQNEKSNNSTNIITNTERLKLLLEILRLLLSLKTK